MKKKVTIIIVLCLYLIRVIYVNIFIDDSGEVRYINQGERVEYKGALYSIDSVKMYTPQEFSLEYPYAELEDDSREKYMILLVGLKIEKTTSAKTEIQQGAWLTYGFIPTVEDMFVAETINRSLIEKGQLNSGDVLYYPYELYKANLTDSQWNDLRNLDMSIAIGTYPILNRLLITEIE